MQVRGAGTIRWAASDGHSPYVGENGNWWQWNDTVGDYVDTGVSAAGVPGMPGKIPIQKEWKVGDTHRNDTNIVDYIYVRAADPANRKWYKLNDTYITRTVPDDETEPSPETIATYYEEIPWLSTLALNVLVAEEANLANFIFKEGKLISVRGTVDGVEVDYAGQLNFIPNISLDGKTGKINGVDADIAGIIHALGGKIGVLDIDSNGNLKLYDDVDTTLLRLAFMKAKIPTVSDILSTTQFGQTVTNTAYILSASGVYTFPNKLTVTKDNSILQFNGTLYLDANLDLANFVQGQATIQLYIYKDGAFFHEIASIACEVDEYNPSYYREIVFSGQIPSLQPVPTGEYSLVMQSSFFRTNGSAGISNTSTFSWQLLKDIRRFEFGLDGFMDWYQYAHLHFTESGGLDGQAPPDKWNAPGILLSATVASGGGQNAVWGAKQSSTSPYKNSTGRYTVYHTIGHTNYQVYASAHSANRSHYIVSKGTTNFVIEWRTIGSSPALVDTTFDVEVIGNNYS